jgi:DNA-directed RNA polymerase subunit beta'
MRTTVGQLIVNEALPEDVRDYSKTLTSGETSKLLQYIVENYPDRYNEIASKLVELGGNASYDESATLSLSDMSPVIDKKELVEHASKQARRIMADKSLSPEDRQAALAGVYGEVQKFFVDETFKKTKESENPFALQVVSKARGSPAQLAALITTPGSYTDSHGNIVPVFVRRSFAEGLAPHEYWAGSYGARKSVISTKFATRQAGDLGKQFNQASMRQIITSDDCETSSGVPVPVDDDDTLGTVLSRKAGKYPAGTVVSKEVLSDLRKKGGVDQLMVRSPITCNNADGICKQCAGQREAGKFPAIGDHVGIQAASALAERIAQGGLNVKHCLHWSTKVLMADMTSKDICDIKEGDMVLGADCEGVITPTIVLKVYHNGPRFVYSTDFYAPGGKSGGCNLTATLDHKVLAVIDREFQFNGMLPIGSCPEGHEFAVPKFEDHEQALKLSLIIGSPRTFIRGKDVLLGLGETYDIEVEHPNHAFLLANGLIVSNSGGMTKSDGDSDDAYSGFDVISQLFQVPKTFPDRASIAELDGEIERVEDAAQGGKNIYINGQAHYVLPGKSVTVKPGDVVEAGDQLSTGILNPREVVQYKGLGEGRRYFTERTTKAFKDSGYALNRRNMDVLVRGVLDSAIVEDPDGIGDFLPGDVVSYSALAKNYRPRENAQHIAASKAVGKYLEQPVMHYTIGTRVTPRLAKNLKDFGHDNVIVHDEKPGFEPYMIGLRAVPQNEQDWMAQLGSSYLNKNLLKNVHRGAESKEHSTHPIPAMARGVDFGRTDEVGF